MLTKYWLTEQLHSGCKMHNFLYGIVGVILENSRMYILSSVVT